jgi:hypothetical protein
VFFLNGTSPTNTSASPPVNSTVQPYDLGANWSVSGIRAGDALWRIEDAEEYLSRVKYQEGISSFDLNYAAI